MRKLNMTGLCIPLFLSVLILLTTLAACGDQILIGETSGWERFGGVSGDITEQQTEFADLLSSEDDGDLSSGLTATVESASKSSSKSAASRNVASLKSNSTASEVLGLGGRLTMFPNEPVEPLLPKIINAVHARDRLSEEAKRYYDNLLPALKSMNETIRVHEGNGFVFDTEKELIFEAYFAVRDDHPELFWLGTSLRCTSFGPFIDANPKYNISPAEKPEMKSKLEKAVSEAKALVSGGMSQFPALYLSCIPPVLNQNHLICSVSSSRMLCFMPGSGP